jgi:hypothetical protein
MLSYQLENIHQDNDFLSYKPLLCRITLAPSQHIETGSAILIQLSRGAKYKGKVIGYTTFPVKGCTVGEMEIVRDSGR